MGQTDGRTAYGRTNEHQLCLMSPTFVAEVDIQAAHSYRCRPNGLELSPGFRSRPDDHSLL